MKLKSKMEENPEAEKFPHPIVACLKTPGKLSLALQKKLIRDMSMQEIRDFCRSMDEFESGDSGELELKSVITTQLNRRKSLEEELIKVIANKSKKKKKKKKSKKIKQSIKTGKLENNSGTINLTNN